MTFHRFRYESHTRWLLRLLGVKPDRDGVRVDDNQLVASFGPLNLVVERSNIESAAVTGPYLLIKTLGPRLSMADHGLTFGTTASAGVCVSFHDPIPAVLGPWRHPGVTLTVEEPERLVRELESST